MTGSIFQSIPPERVGLNGDYDHNGLAKRVDLALRQQFDTYEIDQIRVAQRGTVVVLTGKVAHQRLLKRMMQAVLGVSGAAAVEVTGVELASSTKASELLSCCLNPIYYAY